MQNRIRVGAVSYLNTKPLLYGLEKGTIKNEITVIVDYPANLAAMLRDGSIDLALLPVAAIPGISGAHIVSQYGIAAEGNVASVAIFSQVPLYDIDELYLDYQSRTSVRLAQLLMEQHWKKEVTYLPAHTDYIANISGKKAGVIIGDRALMQLGNFPYVYDLSAAWKNLTGLDFVFAAWVAASTLPASFVTSFNEANALGMKHLPEIIAANPFPYYSLDTYYNENIKFYLDDGKKAGLNAFLKLIG